MDKVVNVTETERKYCVEAFSKDSLWDREFIIYQWYDKEERERKIKLIIDLLSLTYKWVRVTKQRLSNSESKKTIEYITSKDINLDKLIGKMFVCKRRSLKGEICIDSFVRSNNICQYLLEDEGDSSQIRSFAEENDLKIVDVTENDSYRNTNMTTPFTKDDKNYLLFLLKVLKK